MAKQVKQFAIRYEDTCFADYFQGVTVLDQSYWQGVALGTGDSEREAAEDAIECLAQQTGADCEYEVTEAMFARMDAEAAELPTDSAFEAWQAECEPEDKVDEDDVCVESPVVYVAILLSVDGPRPVRAGMPSGVSPIGLLLGQVLGEHLLRHSGAVNA